MLDLWFEQTVEMLKKWLASHVHGAQDMRSQYELNTTRLLFPMRRFCTEGDMSE